MNIHNTVLLNEAIEGLALKANGIYVDGTFGRGGHSQAILNQLNNDGRLIAIDKDEEAIQYAKQKFACDKRFTIVKDSFANISNIARQYNVFGKIQGILLDLGVSSPQLDNPARGFSFNQPGPLDMRMDKDQKLDASSFIKHATAHELTTIFHPILQIYLLVLLILYVYSVWHVHVANQELISDHYYQVQHL